MGGSQKKHSYAVVGSGVAGCMTALELCLHGIDFVWYVGRGIPASAAAGAMVCTLSEWDEAVPVEDAFQLLDVRLSGAAIMRERLVSAGIDVSVSSAIEIETSFDTSFVHTFFRLLEDTKLSHSKTDKSVSLHSEYTVDARRLIGALRDIISRSANCSMVHEDVMSIYESEDCYVKTETTSMSFDLVAVLAGVNTSVLISELDFCCKLQRSYALRGVSLETDKSLHLNIRMLNEIEMCGIHSLATTNGQYFGATSSLVLDGGDGGVPFSDLASFLQLLEKTFGRLHFSNAGNVMSGRRSITSTRLPQFLISSSGRVCAGYGFYRNGFAYSARVAQAVCGLFSGQAYTPIFPNGEGGRELFKASKLRFVSEFGTLSAVEKYLIANYPLNEVFSAISRLRKVGNLNNQGILKI